MWNMILNESSFCMLSEEMNNSCLFKGDLDLNWKEKFDIKLIYTLKDYLTILFK